MNSLVTEIKCPYCGLKMNRYASVVGSMPETIVTNNICQLIDKKDGKSVSYKGCGKPIKVIFEKNNEGKYIGKVIV